ncbi:Uncharacterised protein [Citrobacter amalonaticus]|uniref:Uncharacterized protein n=1 Tax=Citrobacter amalonaticus TaxID=35703 RepID=A0A6N2RYU6_CITAM
MSKRLLCAKSGCLVVLTILHIVGKFYRPPRVIATRQLLISWISNSLLVCISKLTNYLGLA